MAGNFLYMFEFFVDDLLLTKPNCCAPEEYPTCVEIGFRSSVFICICDKEFNKCVDICAPKCCKWCLFSLESPVTDEDRLKVHVYKKKDEKCKFLEGAADLPVKALFDKVTIDFDDTNPNWLDNLYKFLERVPDPKAPNKRVCNDCFTCDDCDLADRPEQFCPTNTIVKRLLPLYNMKGTQTGNISLIVRLVCNGPALVSSYSFSKICKSVCPPDQLTYEPNCEVHPIRAAADGKGKNDGCCRQPDPCNPCMPKKPPCKRYFACNVEKGLPCSDCEDYCDRECPTGCAKERAKARAKRCAKCLECSSPCRSPSPCCSSAKRPPCDPCCKPKKPCCDPCCKPKKPCCDPCYKPKNPCCDPCYKPKNPCDPCYKPKKPQKPKCELCDFIKGGHDCYCSDCQQHIETGEH